MSNTSVLWYTSPARAWTQSLPIGNGTLGAMIYGGVEKDIICLNHDELWTGTPRDTIRKGAPESFKKAQKLALEGRLNEAQKEIQDNFQSVFTNAYVPFGNLEIILQTKGRVKNYKRSLDLGTAVAHTEYTCGKVTYKKEYFASNPDKLIAVRMTAEGGKMTFEAQFSTKLRGASIVSDKDAIVYLDGECPGIPDVDGFEENFGYSDDPQNRGIRYRGGIKVVTDGEIRRADDHLIIKEATYAEIYFTAETSFNGWDKHPYLEGKEYKAPVAEILGKEYNYEAVKAAHIADYTELYNRVALDLEGDDEDIPTDKRLQRFKKKKNDDGLIELVYNFGRFLAITSSRKGTQPSTLQGIWNDKTCPPWRSNYTVNINTEMNYWPVLMCRMPEVNLPLIEMVKDLSISGERTAKGQYNANGWTSHHNVDLWRQSTPVAGNAQWAFWHGSSGWLCEHVYQHYEYTNDVEYLRETAYPLMKKAAEFYLDILVEYDGKLVLAPGTSPENDFWYEGKACSVGKYSTMSMSIARELFENCVKACEILDTDSEFAATLKETLPRLAGFKLGSEGQLLEFDDDYPEKEREENQEKHFE